MPFTWFAQTSTTQQTRNKSYNKNTKEHADTKQKFMIHTRMLTKIITISTINRHLLQKKKIVQAQIHKHNSNFRDSKNDKEHEQ